MLLPDPDGTRRRGPVGRAGRSALRPACRHRRGRSAPRRPLAGVRRPGSRRGPGRRPSGSWTTATPTARSRRCAATASGCSRRYLVDHEGVDASKPLPVGTRDGVEGAHLRPAGDTVSVDMGEPELLGETKVRVGDRSWPALHVSMGNPHAVAFVDDLADAGRLLEAAGPRPGGLPRRRQRGVRRAPRRAARRHAGARAGLGGDPVLRHRRLRRDGRGRAGRRRRPARPRGTTYRVDVPGGRLDVTWTDEGRRGAHRPRGARGRAATLAAHNESPTPGHRACERGLLKRPGIHPGAPDVPTGGYDERTRAHPETPPRHPDRATSTSTTPSSRPRSGTRAADESRRPRPRGETSTGALRPRRAARPAPGRRAVDRARGHHRGRVPPAAARAGRPRRRVDRRVGRGRRELHGRAGPAGGDGRLHGARRVLPAPAEPRPGDVHRPRQGRGPARDRAGHRRRHRDPRRRARAQPAAGTSRTRSRSRSSTGPR